MSTWRNETEGDWQRNAEKLSEFQEGDPVAYWVDIRGRINPTGTEAVNDAFHDRQARQ